MKIEFRKVPFKESEFNANYENITLIGVFYKENSNLVKLHSTLKGDVEVSCIKCLNNFKINIEEKLNLILTDRVYDGFNDDYDVIEINNSSIDFDEIIKSEIESIKNDYNICEKCINNEIDCIK
jgi:uncharacterized metal-binding protein YceD (DUF177 family)